jgi:hypothetical protein
MMMQMVSQTPSMLVATTGTTAHRILNQTLLVKVRQIFSMHVQLLTKTVFAQLNLIETPTTVSRPSAHMPFTLHRFPFNISPLLYPTVYFNVKQV